MGANGQLNLRDSNSKVRVDIRGSSGQIYCRDSNGVAKAFMGDGAIRMWDNAQNETITIDGDSGDIFFRNADCAEEFEIAETEVEPGTVMVLGEDSRLETSRKPYDKKVVGIISGAGGYKPGITFDKTRSSSYRLPIAMMGKVFCKVDARQKPINTGDLLTTSATPGHAMEAGDSVNAFGSVIGKALSTLKDGVGLIPVLVNLQ